MKLVDFVAITKVMLLRHSLLCMADKGLDYWLRNIGLHQLGDNGMPKTVKYEVWLFEVQLRKKLFIKPSAKVAAPPVLWAVTEARMSIGAQS